MSGTKNKVVAITGASSGIQRFYSPNEAQRSSLVRAGWSSLRHWPTGSYRPEVRPLTPRPTSDAAMILN